jgi:transposase
MTHHIKGQGRHQVTLLPEALDDFVTEDNPVRVVDIFVDGLQLDSLGFERVSAKQTGRPGYHPATMLKLYIYGYLNRIQSSRRLEKEAHRRQQGQVLLFATHLEVKRQDLTLLRARSQKTRPDPKGAGMEAGSSQQGRCRG